MKKALTSIAAAALLALAVAPSAGAATEFGDTCSGNVPVSKFTLATLSSPESSPSLTAPTSGVMTKVKMRISFALPFTLPQSIKLMRAAGGNSYNVINETTVQAGAGETVADVRMPIQVGDKLAVRGLPANIEGPSEGATFACVGGVPGTLGAAPGEFGVGSTVSFEEVAEGRVPLAGVIEPDGDNDGYGDETQDGCPRSAAIQTACPVIVLDASPLAGKKAVVVYVAVSNEGSVSVKGAVKLGKGKKATLKSGPKAVYPGKIASFKLKFNSKLTKRLEELEPSKKLTLKITASATNIAGQVSTDQAKAKLKGQG
ncbi:MAG TPA: hypothetical protein VFR75_06070 [Solirubrobacterales bacterium]|nr:hypothetical protein [Solirubrobacterales bacterium]